MWNATIILRVGGRLFGSGVLALAVLLTAVRPAAAGFLPPPCIGGWFGGIINNGERLYGVAALATNDVWAVGEGDAVEHWNGSTWHEQRLDNSLDGELKGIAALAANDMWAVGGYTLAPGLDWGDSYHWNGTTWSHFDSEGDFGPLNAVASLAVNDVWAVG